MLAILRSLQDQHATGFVRLRFEQGALVGVSLGRHALVASVSSAEDAELVAMIDEIRAILADHDLSTVATEFDPDEPEAVEEAPPTPPAAPAAPRRSSGRASATWSPRSEKPPTRCAVRPLRAQPQPSGKTSNVAAWVTPSPWPPPRRMPSRNSSGSQPSQPSPSM